ncbi:putative ROK family transcriptional regulator [Actinacidiphila reveromycinica]|uniref:Putative ROK family transcriptional regulator n=1 Tax=Actinacidiphila reveromycinica TaxID=659352 RepID=A0A7U3UN42_9ACTN|nr:ROK family protein [Streptomyces sp. SN-593]BBA95616.1 putative ROK family transcriptional regulator [Streptomyces sp. SN-593]
MQQHDGLLSRLRRGHEQLVLDLLRTHGPLSRGELGARCGLSRTTLYDIVGALVGNGAVVAAAPEAGPRKRGRPVERLALNPEAGLAIGIDFARRAVHVAAVNVAHEVVGSASEPHGPDLAWSDRVALAERLIRGLAGDSLRLDALSAIGVGVVGPVVGSLDAAEPVGTDDPAATARLTDEPGAPAPGRANGVHATPVPAEPAGPAVPPAPGAPGAAGTAAGATLGGTSASSTATSAAPASASAASAAVSATGAGRGSMEPGPVSRLLEERFKVPVLVDNNTRLAALAESTWGAAAGGTDVLYLRLSHGVGGGLIVGGAPHRGAYGLSGEFGHITVVPDGAACECGGSGCLETVASVGAVLDAYRAAGGRAADIGDVTAAARDGEDLAVAVLAEVGRRTGTVLAAVCHAIGPGVIVLGGELVAAGDALTGPVERELAAGLLPVARDRVDLRRAALGEAGAALGGIALVLRDSPQLHDHPARPAAAAARPPAGEPVHGTGTATPARRTDPRRTTAAAAAAGAAPAGTAGRGGHGGTR